MSQLDTAGRALLERLAAEKPDRFADVPAVRAEDSEGVLAMTLDAARRVVSVEVLDEARLRTPDQLTRAVFDAFATAEGERALASLEANGRVKEALEAAGRRVLDKTPPPSPPRSIVTREASAQRRQERRQGVRPARPERPAPGRSDNGYLTVQRAADGSFLSLDVDPEWLSAATADRLAAAITQAARFGTEH